VVVHFSLQHNGSMVDNCSLKFTAICWWSSLDYQKMGSWTRY